jgi:TRAP-type mannitol/chloroaromatic compound transport system permease small subunit
MPKAIRLFVKYVDAVNYYVGRFAMYLFFPLAAILLYATLSRVIAGIPINWAIEMSQFVLSAYYLLGGPYSMQLNGHVRMDLLWGRFSARQRATTDAVTILFVIFYLIVLFAGGISATNYAIVYQQQNYSSWAPLLWPIKAIMTVGIFLMLLQAISTFFKDLAEARGKPIA